jgi:hypothetical protein
MDHTTELKYFIERTVDYAEALEEKVADLQVTDDTRILFRVMGRPFEVLPWIDEDNDLLCVTTRTADFEPERLEDAVNILQDTLQTCWDHCVSVMPVERRYDLSMAIFIGGFTFEAFEGIIYNLLGCAEAVEQKFKGK